jgi:hypothetical protein
MDKRKIESLRELPLDVAPGRDLWPAIEAAIREPASQAAPRATRRVPQFLALAATVAALAIGVWIGRSTLPVGIGAPTDAPTARTAAQPAMVQAAFVNDPQYRRERAALVRSLESRLAALPPETRQKVAVSLQTIRKSMQDLEAALGRDPSNALLQELLVNTYQEEMRVLSEVNQAGTARQEI